MQTGPGYPPPPPPYHQGYYPPPVTPSKPQRGGAIAIEAVLALLGVYGVGWLMDGKQNVGIPLMIGGFAWDIFLLFIGIFTAGTGFCCLVPMHLAFIAISTILLATRP